MVTSIDDLKNSNVNWSEVMVKAANDKEDKIFMAAAKLNEDNWRNVCEDLTHDYLLDGDEEYIRFIYKYYRLSEPEISIRAELVESILPLGLLDAIIFVCKLDNEMIPFMACSCCKFNSWRLWGRIKNNKDFKMTLDGIKQFMLQATVHNRQKMLIQGIELYDKLSESEANEQKPEGDEVHIFEMLYMLAVERDLGLGDKDVIKVIFPRVMMDLPNANEIMKNAEKSAEIMGHYEMLEFCKNNIIQDES